MYVSFEESQVDTVVIERLVFLDFIHLALVIVIDDVQNNFLPIREDLLEHHFEGTWQSYLDIDDLLEVDAGVNDKEKQLIASFD